MLYNLHHSSIENLIFYLDTLWEDIIVESSGLWAGMPWCSPEGVMKSFEISYIIEGDTTLNMNNSIYHAKKGSFFFTDLSFHSSCKNPLIKMHYITFRTANQELYRNLKTCFAGLFECIQAPEVKGVEESFNTFHYENSIPRPYSRLLLKQNFLNILITLHRLQVYSKEGINPIQISSRQGKMVDEIVRYLEEHYKNSFQLSHIAHRLNLNPRYINLVFKKHTGTTIIQYLIKLRIQKSKRLLRFTSMSTTDIALDLGFCDCQHFCKTFKQLEGTTPDKFRKSQ